MVRMEAKFSAMIEISIVVPVYKEASNIRPFLERAEKTLEQMGQTYEIIFALDPSPDDATEDVILQEIQRNSAIRLLIFSRRFGQPAAIIAGILSCKGKVCVVIDVDLQDPPELIHQLHNKLCEGYEVVYAKRRSRKGESALIKVRAYLGYMLINYLSEIPIPRNTGDCRIITRRVMEELRRINETHGFLRGLIAHIGFKQTYLEYDRDPRLSGKSHYTFLSLRIGFDGIIGFSSRPLQLLSICGFILAASSFLLGCWNILEHVIGRKEFFEFPIIILVVAFFSGIQLLALGLVGEYIGRIYNEVKRRPMYIIDKAINF